MRISHKTACGLQFKAGTSEGVLEGYGSTWDRDLGGDRFEQGAYADVIANEVPVFGVKGYREHYAAVGLVTEAKEDDTGLWLSMHIVPGSSVNGDETLSLAKDGVYGAFSVGYVVDPRSVKYVMEGGSRTRVMGRVKSLPHVGVVDNPMNTTATIESVKGQMQLMDPETKGLWTFARGLEALATLEEIRAWGVLDDDEAALAQQLLDDMAETAEAIKAHLPTEPDLAGLTALSEAAKSLTELAKRNL